MQRLERILPQVQNPARYIGGEANGITKSDAEVQGRIALVFPDTYEVGMSNNGLRILYHCVNREEGLLAETAFAPWKDMGALMQEEGILLYTHQSYSSVKDFDIVGITLQTELNYTNVPYILELSGIPVWSAERTAEHPFVVGGGPCMANPEPVADFFDFFLIGDGEIAVPEFTRIVGTMRSQGASREEILRAVAAVKGVYVPALMPMQLSDRNEWVPGAEFQNNSPYLRAKGVSRTWVEILDPENVPVSNLVPNTKLVHNRYSVEVMRGCTNGCRFCQAGYWYRPNRELNPDAVVELSRKGLAATGEKELGLLSLSTADYSQVERVTDALVDDPYFRNFDVSLPSLRANSFGQNLAVKVAAIKGGRSSTFAPETGSERLRKMINKTISDQDMIEAADGVFKAGFNKIKLYTMVGLPTENLDDMEAFCRLIESLVKVARRYNKGYQVHASVGVMVPKPFTPMQWVGFMERETVERHIQFVRERFRDNRQVRISWTAWHEAHLEAFYARGDRSLAPMIYEAYQRGLAFESFAETRSYPVWEELWEKYGYNQDHIFRERSLDEVFPWDYIHIGVTKGYLKKEYKNMFIEDSPEVPDCKWGKDSCQSCGVPGNYADTQLAPEPSFDAPKRTADEVQEIMAAWRERKETNYAYRLVIKKVGMAKFLPHHNTADLIDRAFGRVGAPLAYTKGFSPKPKIGNSGALPLGLESWGEEYALETLAPVPEGQEFLAELGRVFPGGVEVVKLERIAKAKPKVAEAILYGLPGAYDDKILAKFQAGELPKLINHRGQEIDVQAEIQSIHCGEGNRLDIWVRANIQGVTTSPFLLYAGLLDMPQEQARILPLIKIEQKFAD